MSWSLQKLKVDAPLTSLIPAPESFIKVLLKATTLLFSFCDHWMTNGAILVEHVLVDQRRMHYRFNMKQLGIRHICTCITGGQQIIDYSQD